MDALFKKVRLLDSLATSSFTDKSSNQGRCLEDAILCGSSKNLVKFKVPCEYAVSFARANLDV